MCDKCRLHSRLPVRPDVPRALASHPKDFVQKQNYGGVQLARWAESKLYRQILCR